MQSIVSAIFSVKFSLALVISFRLLEDNRERSIEQNKDCARRYLFPSWSLWLPVKIVFVGSIDVLKIKINVDIIYIKSWNQIFQSLFKKRIAPGSTIGGGHLFVSLLHNIALSFNRWKCLYLSISIIGVVTFDITVKPESPFHRQDSNLLFSDHFGFMQRVMHLSFSLSDMYISLLLLVYWNNHNATTTR